MELIAQVSVSVLYITNEVYLEVMEGYSLSLPPSLSHSLISPISCVITFSHEAHKFECNVGVVSFDRSSQVINVI
jgi:hypothetical protein